MIGAAHQCARVLNNALNRFFLECWGHTIESFGGSPEAALIFILVWRVGLGDVGKISSAGQGGISVNAIAASLQRPYESVRRRLRAMVETGECDSTVRGVTIGRESPGARIGRALAPKMTQTLGHLIDAHQPLLRPQPWGEHNAGSALESAHVATALDVLLSFNDCHAGLGISWSDLAILAAITSDSSRGDTGLAAGPADIPVHSIARAVSLPYATVRRRVYKLMDNGYIIQRVGKFGIAPIGSAATQANTGPAAVATRARWLLSRLAGLEPAADAMVAA